MLWDLAKDGQVYVLPGHSEWVHAIAFSPDGLKLASASADYTIKICDLLKLRRATLLTALTEDHVRTLRDHLESVNSVAFSPDALWLASGGDDGQVRIWNVRDGRGLLSIFPSSDFNWLTVAPNGAFDSREIERSGAVSWVMPDDPLPPFRPKCSCGIIMSLGCCLDFGVS